MGTDKEKEMLVVIKEEYSLLSETIVQRQEVYFSDSYGEVKALEWANKCRPFPKSHSEENFVYKVWTERRDED